MKAKGQDILPGMKIRYVVVSGREKIRERAKIPEEITQKDYDAEYYINNQVVPAVETILEVFGYEGEEIAQSHQQSKLGSYF